MLRFLLEAGAELEQSKGEKGMRPLHLAAQMGHVDALRVLVEFGADKDLGKFFLRRFLPTFLSLMVL